MEIPKFLRLEGDALVFNEEGELLMYIPEELFTNSKNTIAKIVGSYVSTIGICDYCLVSKNGTMGQVRPFRFPTIFLSKPSHIEKGKGIKLTKSSEGRDYRILHFVKGDEVVSQIHVPQIIDNVEIFFAMMVVTGRIPTTIRYDVGHEYFPENMELNGSSYGLDMQLFGIIWSELCRDPKNLSRPFCMTDMKDMNAYRPISIKLNPNFISPYVSLASENFDESLRAAILIDDEDIQYSPLEKVVTQ